MRPLRIIAVLATILMIVACQDKKSGPAAAASAAPSVAVTLKPPTTPIKAGQPLNVAWTGPNGADDYVDVVAAGRALQVGDEIAYAKTATGNPVKLTAPPAPGTYDVRYVQDTGARTVIAHVSIVVVP